MVRDRVIVFALLACRPGVGAAQQRSPAECSDSSKTQASITACSGDSYKAADRRLQSLVAELRDSVPAPQRAERRIAELAPLLCRQGGQPRQPCPAADRYRPPDRAASKRRH